MHYFQHGENSGLSVVHLGMLVCAFRHVPNSCGTAVVGKTWFAVVVP